ncbi:hypothetical protein F5Y15DRAFT_63272 [Xylariaceae sp. FL0016]|nr:hypothetical protein F5Y15DRAFT_63272 [Xylariaceae sp. FL0016]
MLERFLTKRSSQLRARRKFGSVACLLHIRSVPSLSDPGWQPSKPRVSTLATMSSRVCDRCIRKKVKCDLQRPFCSRCSEAGLPCTYSTERRKPGPPRGARRQKHATQVAGSNSTSQPQPSPSGSQDGPSGPRSMGTQSPSLGSSLLAPGDLAQMAAQTSLSDFNDINLNFSPYGSMTAPSESQFGYPGYYLEPAQERDLLVHFFDEVHSAVPLFQKNSFLSLYDNGLAYRDLVVTMITVTARILGPISYWRTEDVKTCIGWLLKSTSFQDDSAEAQMTLDQFRQQCLLAYYEFHQFPGPSSLMRISRVTRKAYAVGLNQIDNPDLCSAFDAAIATEDEVEDWRCIWWCVYCLDSYSNIPSGAPFIVELESINTALARRNNGQQGEGPVSPQKIFLPEEVDELWKTAQELVASSCMSNYNMHMITTTILRQAGSLLRLRTEGKRLPSRLAAVKRNLASLRLALPPRYLNPARNVLKAETNADHHTRLTNILHLHMVRLIVSMPSDSETNEEVLMGDWQQSLETVQDMVSVFEQWNNHYSHQVDPAICLIVFSGLWIMNIYRRTIADTSQPLYYNLIQGENMFLLFLRQFSSLWSLPELLIQQFNSEETNSSLTFAEAARILSHFKTPLHPKRLQASPAMTMDSMNGIENLGSSVNFAELWPFNPSDATS